MKKIGIVGHFTGSNSFGVTLPYIKFFSNFGQVSVISPWEKEIRELDLLVLPGGPDVDVFRYLGENEDIHVAVGAPCMIRERFDKILLPKYVEAKTPIFGICRGHQSLAVFFGAKLIQHMYHETNPSDNRGKLMHKVKVNNIASQLINDLKSGSFDVNSIHHQVVKNCPEIASVLATHDGKDVKHNEIGVIEALTYYPEYPAHTVQWHPEEIYDEFSITLISDLLKL